MGRKILIIDDEDDIREVASLSLETVAGWEVIKASSGAQGISRAAEQHPDAILLDVMMPGMDGPATFRELRKNPATAGIPVLAADCQGSGYGPAPIRRPRRGGCALQALRSPHASRADFARARLEVTAIAMGNPPNPLNQRHPAPRPTQQFPRPWKHVGTSSVRDPRARRRP